VSYVILVTGAGGFIGSRLCHYLAARGNQVTGLWHHDSTRLESLADTPRFAALQGDIRQPGAWLPELAEIETVFHLAAQPPTPPGVERTTNREGTGALLAALSQVGVHRWVFTSTMSVYDFHEPDYLPVDETHRTAPLQPYGVEKLEAEGLLAASRDPQIQSISLRLAGIFGPGREGGAVHHFIRCALDGQPIEIEADRQIDILHIDDAIQAMILAQESLSDVCGEDRHRVYNIGRGEPTALTELAQAASVAAGREVPISSQRAGSTFYMSIAAATRDLRYVPASLDEGLADVAAWVQDEEAVTS
jgi:UDP-glucose 4-epimerase